MTKIKPHPALFVVLATAILLLIDLFLPWQETDGSTLMAVLAALAVALVAILSALQLSGRMAKIPAPPAVLILLPSLLALILVVIKFFVDSDDRQPAAWIGLVLAIALYAAAVWNVLPLVKMGIQMRKMMKAHKATLAAAAAPVAAAETAAPAPAKEAAAGGTSCDGDWAVTMETPMGVQEMTLTLQSIGSELTGKADTPFGVQEFSGGVVKGDNIAWEIDVTTPMPMTLTFKATIIGDELGGTAEVAGMGESPFQGTRVKA